MTTYIIVAREAKKYDSIINKIKITAKKTRAKIVSMEENAVVLDREKKPVYRHDKAYDPKDCNLAGIMDKIVRKRIVYEGNIKNKLFFTTKREAVDFWKKQSYGLPVCDPFRYILRDNRKAKNIKDSWDTI